MYRVDVLRNFASCFSAYSDTSNCWNKVLLLIFKILFWVFINLFTEKTFIYSRSVLPLYYPENNIIYFFYVHLLLLQNYLYNFNYCLFIIFLGWKPMMSHKLTWSLQLASLRTPVDKGARYVNLNRFKDSGYYW